MPSFTLVPRGPFSLDRSADCVASFPPLRHQPGRGEDGVIRLGFILDETHAPVAVALRAEADTIHVDYAAPDGKLLLAERQRIAKQVARIFSLDHDATDYPLVGQRDHRVGALMRTFDGLRPVCFTSPYECAAWAVISQRITTVQATRIVGTIVKEHGADLVIAGERVRIFPTPQHLLAIDTIPGLASVKVERLHAIARAALDGKLDADRLRALGDEEAPRGLQELPGIGPFWSSGIYLRGCGIVDVFPDEPIAMTALAALHGRSSDAATIARLTLPLRPFRMWVCFLLRVAFARGLIEKRAKVVSRPVRRLRTSSANRQSLR
jgi:DNA-3-methyladenine glycosylase II